MKSLKESIQDNDFIITAEMAPPKGTDVKLFLKHGQLLKGLVNAVNVTDNQRSIMRLGSLGGSILLANIGHDPIMQVTCRDRNRIALQSDLLNAHVLGIKNILVLTGDYINLGDHIESKPVYDLDSVMLLKVIANLNNGLDLAGNALKGNTDFLAGAALALNAVPFGLQLIKFEKKLEAGARFFQTQPVFDLNLFTRFLATYEKRTVKIIAGVLLLKSAKMAGT